HDLLLSRLWQKYPSGIQVLPLLWKFSAHRGGACGVRNLCQFTCVILPSQPGLPCLEEIYVQPACLAPAGSKRGLNSSFETSPKKVKWSSTVTSPRLSLFSDGDSSESEDTLSSSERSKGSGSRPPTPKSSPQKTRKSPQKTSCSPQKTKQSPQKTSCSPQTLKRSPQTLKRSRVTTSLEALPTGTVLTDKSGRQWKLKFLQTRDDQGILYEAAPTSTLAYDSELQKQKFSLKLSTSGRSCTRPRNWPSLPAWVSVFTRTNTGSWCYPAWGGAFSRPWMSAQSMCCQRGLCCRWPAGCWMPWSSSMRMSMFMEM
uniref:VRK serine/threonine kinase 3 n=1 Tax=Macaca fascicularis TaxID=9541 RepID=A0A7N9CC97_MACFA